MHPLDWIDIAALIGGWTLVAFGCAGVVWWLIGTPRWRTRRAMGRCAGCHYDMTGVAPGVCPECGRAASARRFRRGGRNWRWLVLLTALLACGYVLGRTPQVRAKGWARLIPTAVLAAWPMDVKDLIIDQDWGLKPPGGWGQNELKVRLLEEDPGDVAESILAWRLRRVLAAEGELWDGASEQGEEPRSMLLDTGPLWRSIEYPPDPLGVWPSSAKSVRWRIESTEGEMFRVIEALAEIWEEPPTHSLYSQHMLVRARPATLARVRRAAEAMARCTQYQPQARVDDVLVWRAPHEPGDVGGWLCDEDIAPAAVDCLARAERSRQIRSDRADLPKFAWVKDRLLVRGPESALDRAARVLELVGRCERTGEPGECEGESGERVAVWSICKIFRIEHGVSPMSGDLASRFDELRIMLQDGADIQGLSELDTSFAARVGSTLVVWTLRKEQTARAGELLRAKAAVEEMRTRR